MARVLLTSCAYELPQPLSDLLLCLRCLSYRHRCPSYVSRSPTFRYTHTFVQHTTVPRPLNNSGFPLTIFQFKILRLLALIASSALITSDMHQQYVPEFLVAFALVNTPESRGVLFRKLAHSDAAGHLHPPINLGQVTRDMSQIMS